MSRLQDTDGGGNVKDEGERYTFRPCGIYVFGEKFTKETMRFVVIKNIS